VEKHIFKFGSNSAALIIPKKWLDGNGLKFSDTVYVTESESGNLVISPKETAKKRSEKVVTSKTKPLFLSRWVGLHYMYGTGKLRIYSADGLTQAQIEGIEDEINAECPGFEITSQSNKDMEIEDFTDIKEINLDKVISRLKSLINQEFAEIKQGDPKTIARLEKLVNRSYMMGVRYVNITQAKDALVYFGILESLETVSDKLDAISSDFEIPDPHIFAELDAEFELCFPAMKGDSKALEKVAELRESMIKRLLRSRLDRMCVKLLIEIANSISSIAEFGLRVENENALLAT
jgi:antitoxin component of MazEF toxin-antitoxin module